MPASVSTYRPRGGALDLFHARESEVLLGGPAGTGKSRVYGELIWALANLYPGSRYLVCRKTLASLRESWQVTFEDKVVPHGHPVLRGASRLHRHSYILPNRSAIVLGGLDRPEKLYSTEWDVVYVNEATEITKDAWERFHRSLRWGHLPFAGIRGDCNPDSPQHWLYKRFTDGPLRYIESHHADNPTLSAAYLERLEHLTGVRRERLLLGRWVAAEGMIWPMFAHWKHVVPCVERVDGFGNVELVLPPEAEGAPERTVPIRWTFGVQDFGIRSPGCAQVWGVDHLDRQWRLAEVYYPEHTIDWWTAKWKWLTQKYRPRFIAADPDQTGSIDLMNQYLSEPRRGPSQAQFVRPAHKDREAGWNLVGDMLLDQPEYGTPGILWAAHAEAFPAGRCLELGDQGEPMCSEEEVPGYVWKEVEDGKPLVEEPHPAAADHGCDDVRYAAVAHWHPRMDLTPPASERVWPPGTLGHELGFDEVDVDY